MIIARAHRAGERDLVVAGLSAENVRRLQAGKPILLQRAHLDAAGLTEVSVAIVYGETEQAIARELGVAEPLLSGATQGSG